MHRFLTTTVSAAFILPILNPFLHILYLIFLFSALFICGIVLAHCTYEAHKAGIFNRAGWAIRNSIAYYDPIGGAFWITGWGGKVFDPKQESYQYF